jgi:hypothetical protein
MKELARKFWVFGIAALAAIVFALAGCDQLTDAITDGNNNTEEEEEEEPGFVAVTDITLLKTSMVKNTPIDLNDPEVAVVSPEDATVKGPIAWYVIDAGTTGVGTGSVEGGTLAPTAAGTITLSATIDNAAAEGADYEKITGLAIEVTDAFVPVMGITWTPPEGKKAGETFEISGAVVAPTNATNKTITWSVAEGSAVSAEISGTATTSVTPAAEGAGTLKLSATVANGAAEGTDWTRPEPFSVTITATYPITVTPSDHGTVTTNVAREAAGETVSLTATPADNTYRLKEGTLKANSVTVTGSANPYTFTMPANSVTITAEFELVPPDTYNITIPSFDNGAVSASADNAAAETMITLTVTPAAVYKLTEGSLAVTKSGGGTVPVSGSGPYTFTMPADDVTVAAAFESAVPDGYKTIATADDLAKIGTNDEYPLSGNYYQIADITISGTWTPIGGTSGTPFTGVYDGGDMVIFPDNISASEKFGIFWYANGAKFKNIHIGTKENPGSITTSAGAIGAIVFSVTNTDFTNCSNAATLSSTAQAYGICGAISAGTTTFDHCWNSGNITGTSVGGICGSVVANTVIQNCWNEGTISGASAGGIANLINSGKVIACYNTGSVTGSGTTPSVGGITSGVQGTTANSGYIIACHNSGAVSSAAESKTNATIYLGGIAGKTTTGYVVVTASYNIGAVSWTGTGEDGVVHTGGVIGYSGETPESGNITKAAEITDCYWKADGNPAYGRGAIRTNETTYKTAQPNATDPGTFKFGDNGAWPSSNDAGWGLGNDSANGKYWTTLGSSPSTYPRLWFE